MTVSAEQLINIMLVRVGSGSKAHAFRPHPKSNMKRFELEDGGTVYDIALCGSRGAMVMAAADTDMCATCEAALERDAQD